MTTPVALDQAAWSVNPYPWATSQRLAETLGLPLVAAMILAGRGFTDPEAARVFLEASHPLPDPFLFEHMDAAVKTISQAIDTGRRIVVHGDYDADGITATAVLVLGLRGLGMEVEWYLPSRFNEGYGLSRTAVETISSKGPAVLITVDCGVNYPEEVKLARDRGLEVVVVDHHQPGPVLPECSLIHEVAGEYPHGDLCGVGLALKVMHALHIRLCDARHDVLPRSLHALLDLVAIGTIADLAPLQGENRFYVKEGLKLIGIGQRPGVRELAAVASCSGAVDSGAVAYRLAPRLNAAGRLADPSPPLRLLLTEDDAEARRLAAQLHEINGARQDVERQMLEEALARVDALEDLPAALVLAGEEWHEGVVGIVASRLVERYHRPTIMLGVRDGVAKGSGRSISGYDLMGALTDCAGFLTVFGGHRQAVGLTLSAGEVDGFRAAVEQHAAQRLTDRDLVPAYRADAVLRGEDVNADVALALASFGPFGSGNPKPRLLVVSGSVERADVTRNGAHLRCMVDVDGVRVRGIGFGLGGLLDAVRENGGNRTLGVQLRVDEWQGALRPEFLVERIGPRLEQSVPWVDGCTPQPEAAEGESCARQRAVLRATVSRDALRFALGRDLRDCVGRLSALAQVLGSGEPVFLLMGSIAQTLPRLERHLPLDALCDGAFDREGRSRSSAPPRGGSGYRVVPVEWDAAPEIVDWSGAGAHAVAVDPPFRDGHMAFLRSAAARGAAVHLYYGEEERRSLARLLRYLVHPRFAMVCLFRALQAGPGDQNEILALAARLAWDERHVVLTAQDFARAATILDELGGERVGLGEAKLDVRSSPTYVAAEADYEECVRLCQTL